MDRPILLLFLFLSSVSIGAAAAPFFHQVEAKSGDSIYKLLDRYELAKHQCNFTQFYKLNKLNHKSYLYQGKKYFIPVMIYEYNGKTIRSSIGIKDWSQAVRIKKYNEQLLANNLRRKSIVSSRILWVPFHELNCEKKVLQKELPAAPAVVNSKAGTTEKPGIPTGTIIAKKDQKPFEFKDSPRYFTVYSKEEGKPVVRRYEKTNRVLKNLSGSRNFSIFGKKNAHVPLVNESLTGQVYYVVSGHGGPDAGAVKKHYGSLLCEDEYAYDVALRLTRKLIERGATAYMITRDPNDGIRSGEILKNDKDEYCWGNLKMPHGQKKRLFQRSDIVNALYLKHKKQGVAEQKLIAIHVDSRSVRQQTDLYFYHFPGSKAGKNLADKIHRTVRAKYREHRPGRGYSGTVTERDLHMLRETPATSVYVELGNIRNAYDRKRILPASNRQALADWLFEGLIK